MHVYGKLTDLSSERAHLRSDALAPTPYMLKAQPVVPVPFRPLVPAPPVCLVMHALHAQVIFSKQSQP